MAYHTPVLLEEVVRHLQLKKNDSVIDATAGGGGHLIALARVVGPKGRVLGIDADADAVTEAGRRIEEEKLTEIAVIVHDNFSDLEKRAKQEGFQDVQGILFDLGVSSHQLDEKEKGFGFQASDLDMRMDASQKLTAKMILETYPAKELERIFREYGEERLARPIANAIVGQRKKEVIERPWQLIGIIRKVYGRNFRGRSKKHPATKIFRALRIEVNGELESLEAGLEQALKLLAKNGRMAVISFHSLEDRMVKQFFKKEARNCVCPQDFPICECGHMARLKIITKKPVQPGAQETEENPRSRSAKMRVAEKR